MSDIAKRLRARTLAVHGGPSGVNHGWNLTEGDSLLHLEAAEAIAALLAERDALAAERDALRADAERYRWLRDKGDSTWRPMASRVPEGGKGIDAAIDAARGAA